MMEDRNGVEMREGDRKIILDALTLARCAHRYREAGLCVMEAAAWFAGEEHTDRPACVSPVVTTFAMGLNDAWDDEQRQKLKQFIPLMVGTDDDRDNERKLMAADWLIRTHTPAWLRLAGLDEHADRLVGLPVLSDWSMLDEWMEPLAAARQEAHAAGVATGAAGAAAWRVIWAAGWDAARIAADAAGAARAAGDVAGAAARYAAWAATGPGLKPTVDMLQTSALDLLNRMVTLEERP